MVIIYNRIIHPLLSLATGHKVFTCEPHMGVLIDAQDADLIADEQYRIGMAYLNGEYMLPQSFKKALPYFRKAAERGHAIAQLYMMRSCMKRSDDNNNEVMSWLQKSAEQGEPQALYNLGISYHRGDIGGKADISKSNELFRQSAESGYSAAYSRMAAIYSNGEGVEKNLTIAKYWAALDFNDLPKDSRENAILFQLIDKDYVVENGRVNSMKILEDAANAGERDAMLTWAGILNGRGEQDEKVQSLLKNAADLKHPKAMVDVARHYWKKEISNYELARTLFEESAKTGSVHAYYGLAVMYYTGAGVSRNIEKAWEYLEKGINRGDAECRYLFAMMYFNNDMQDILPDKVLRSWDYLELAAKDNFQPALDFYKKRMSQPV